MRLPFLALALTVAAAPLACAGTPGSFVVFSDIPQFGIYVSTPPDYTPPAGVYMLNNGTEFVTRLTAAERGKIGADVSANVTYLAQCDNYDRIGSLFMIVKPRGVIPTTSDPTIELVRWITPFSDYTQGQYATHSYPAADLYPFAGVMTDSTKDIWIGIAGGSNPYSGDPCTNAGVSADFAAVGFSYSVSFTSTKPLVAQGTAVSAPVVMADYTSVPVSGSAASTATGNATALVIVSGHGSATGGDEYKHTRDTLSVNGASIASFNTEANCSSYAKYSPDGNPFIFIGNGGSNPRNWCPGALVPSHSFFVTIGANNTVALDMDDPSVPSGSYYDTSVTLIKN
jgi:hypothetical protein